MLSFDRFFSVFSSTTTLAFLFSLQPANAQEYFRFFFFRNKAVAGFEFNDSDPKKLNLKYARDITNLTTIYEGVGLNRFLAGDHLAQIFSPIEDIQILTAPPSALEFTWFQTSDGVHYLFQDGTLAKSSSSEPRLDSRAKLILQNGKKYFVESYINLNGQRKTLLCFNLEGSQCQTLAQEFFTTIHNPFLHYLGKMDGSEFLVKISPECNLHLISHADENYTVESCPTDPRRVEGIYVTRVRDGKSLRASYRPFRLPESASISLQIQDGILTIPRVSKKIDLQKFDDEVSLFGALKPMEKLTQPEGKPIFIEQEVRSKYPDLVSEARQHPERFFQESRPELSTRMAEALRAHRSVVLLGEAGTGKTSAVKAFARDVGQGKVKGFPRTTEIFEISSSSLASSTMYTGTIETRISELKAMAKGMGAIFFFDELHSLAGTGTHSHQSNDVTQQLKGPIEAGEMKIIATDTPLEFIDAYSWDLPFVQRFEKISTLPPSKSDQIRMIQEQFLAKGYPRLSSELIQMVIELTQRFEPTSEQPRPSVNLLTMALQRMVTLDRPEEEPTLEIVNTVVKERYGLDIALFQPSVLKEKLSCLKMNLEENVIGQDKAKQALHQVWATHLNRASLSTHRINSLLFAGPGGVGKSWIIESSTQWMGYQTNRISMNQYSARSKWGVSEFQEEIYKSVEKHPFTVLVLEGIEDADESVQNSLIPMLNDGKFTVMITHSGGRRTPREVSVKDVIFFITTRSGSDISHLEKKSKKELREILAAQKISPALLSQLSFIIPLPRPTREEFERGIGLYLERTLREQNRLYHANFKLEDPAGYMKKLTQTYGPHSDYRDIEEAMRSIEAACQEASLAKDFARETDIIIRVEAPKKSLVTDSLEDAPLGVQMMYQ